MPFEQYNNDETMLIPLPDGVRLWGLIRRHSMLAPRGLAVLVHGRLHRHDKGPLAELAATGRLPFDLFTFDQRGYGQSTGATSYANAEQEAQDLHCVIQHLRGKGERILAMLGHSKGAVALFMYAASHTPPCRLMISLSARYSAREHNFRGRFTEAQQKSLEDTGQMVWLHYKAGEDDSERRPFKVTEAELVKYEAQSLATYIPKIAKKTHWLTVHGRSDGTVKSFNSESIDMDLKKEGIASDFFLLDGIAHNYDLPGEIELLAALVRSWILSRNTMRGVDGNKPLVDHLNKAAVQESEKELQM